jgi:hypothetical protein
MKRSNTIKRLLGAVVAVGVVTAGAVALNSAPAAAGPPNSFTVMNSMGAQNVYVYVDGNYWATLGPQQMWPWTNQYGQHYIELWADVQYWCGAGFSRVCTGRQWLEGGTWDVSGGLTLQAYCSWWDADGCFEIGWRNWWG